jgi:hydroxymethylbilane synthase
VKSTGTFTLGTLDGRLNRAQTQIVIEHLRRAHPKAMFDMVTVAEPSAHRDRDAELYSTHAPAEVSFLQEQLREGRYQLLDICAEDLKLPLPDGLTIAAVLSRDTPYDALLHKDGVIADDLPEGTLVGVLSYRSQAQISTLWPNLKSVLLRGGTVAALNRFVQQDEVECLVIPAAVGERLGVQDLVSEIFFPEMMLPGAGQGLIALLARADDSEAIDMAAAVDSPPSRQEMMGELAFRERICSDQDCPVGVLAQANDGSLIITGAIGSRSGSAPTQAVVKGDAEEAAELGVRLAEELLQNTSSLIALVEADFPDGLPEDHKDGLGPEEEPTLGEGVLKDLEGEKREEDLDEYAPPRDDL